MTVMANVTTVTVMVTATLTQKQNGRRCDVRERWGGGTPLHVLVGACRIQSLKAKFKTAGIWADPA